MGNEEPAVRALTADDLDWVVDVADRRGEQRQSFAPRFWRRAPDARRTRERFLGSLIADPAVPALRTDHAFAFGARAGERRAGPLLVDDAAVESPEQWATEGAALLRRLAGGRRLRFVCPVPEPERAALAVRLGLTCREAWWHRDLPEPVGSPATATAPVRLVPAPPVYAPGGPVLLVTEFRGRRALAEEERRAAHRGAVVSVVAMAPGDRVREEVLFSMGYRRTCEFYEGRP